MTNVEDKFLLSKNQETQKKYYDRTARPLPVLTESETVRFKILPKAKWEPAVVMRKHETSLRRWCSVPLQQEVHIEITGKNTS